MELAQLYPDNDNEQLIELMNFLASISHCYPEELKPLEPSPKAKKGKKKNAKIVQGEASTSDVKPAADESQIVSIPKESEGDAEIASTPPEPSPKAKKGKKNAKNAPEKKGKKKNVVAEEVIEDVDTNEAVSAKDPEEGADAVEDMEEKVPAKKTKAAAKKGSTKAKEKIEAVEEEKSTKRANKRNPSPTEVEAEKEVAEKAKPINKKGASKSKGLLISECLFDLLQFSKKTTRILTSFCHRT